jgi:NtrC-family two-component system sensor histidine kinase KinB
MKLRTKILGGYCLILSLMMIVWAVAVVNLYRVGRAGEAILRENQLSVQAAESMINHLERQDSAALLFLLGDKQGSLTQFRDNQVEFSQWLGRARDNLTEPGEDRVVADIDAGYRAFMTVFQTMTGAGLDSRKQALAFYYQEFLPQFLQVRQFCFVLREMNQTAMEKASRHAHRLSVRTIWSMTGVGAASGTVGLVLSILLSGILIRPLAAMSRVTEQLAEGDYNVTLEVPSSDELGLLARQIITMSQKLKAFHELNVGRLIAEKRRGEAILRSIGDGLIVVDEAFRIIAVNPEAARLLHLSVTESQGRLVSELLPQPQLLDIIRQTAESGQASKPLPEKAEICLGAGEVLRYFRFSVTPILSEGGKHIQGVVVLLQDITRLKELERLKSEFVLAASHELKTPLTGLAMSISLLQELSDQMPERQRELIRVAQEETGRLRALVSDLLDLSRLESGRVEMEIVSLNVAYLFEKTLAAFYDQAEAKGIALVSQIRSGTPEVLADPTKIAWVISNLISNALRYTPTAGHIRITAEGDRGRVFLAVADDGAGIPPEYRSRIFDKFVQVKGDSKAGSGLGLAICKEIVKAHGGSIWVDSTLGKGSTFTFDLKAASPAPGGNLPEEKKHG